MLYLKKSVIKPQNSGDSLSAVRNRLISSQYVGKNLDLQGAQIDLIAIENY